MFHHHVGRFAPVPRRERLSDGVDDQPTGGVPVGGPPVQLGDLVWRLATQLATQQLGEQLVVAVGAAPRPERLHEGVGPRQPGQRPLAIVAAGERIGQVAVQFPHDAGPQQEAA